MNRSARIWSWIGFLLSAFSFLDALTPYFLVFGGRPGAYLNYFFFKLETSGFIFITALAGLIICSAVLIKYRPKNGTAIQILSILGVCFGLLITLGVWGASSNRL